MNFDVAASSTRPPARSRAAVAIATAVLVITASLIGWSAWPVLRPAPMVVVSQAIHTVATPASLTRVESDPQGASVTRSEAVQAAGWLEAEPFVSACVALTDGVIESINVLEGDRVEEGQLVARLIAKDSEIRLRRAKADLDLARADLEASEADLKGSQASWDHPIELQRSVASGMAALRESQAELDQVPALLDSARAMLERLEEEYARVEVSHRGDAATDLELINARQRAIAQRAEVAALEGRGPVLAARIERLTVDARAAERHLELRIDDRRALELAQASVGRSLAAVDIAAAAYDEAALELERAEIRSPIAGYVQRRLKSPGDKVVRAMDTPHSAHVLYVYDPSRLQVRVDVPLADAGKVRVGQPCEIVVEVAPSQKFGGEVLRVTHEADIQKNTLQVKVAVIDPSPMLRPEMLARVTFQPGNSSREMDGTSSDSTHLRVPSECLDERGGSARVWVVRDRMNGRGVLKSIKVTPIDRDGSWVTVSGPLQPGELVASAGVELREGRTVRFTAPRAQRGATP